MDGFEKGVLVKFSTRQLSPTQRVKFHYAFKGRNGSTGILDTLNAQHIAPSVVIIPSDHYSQLKEFFTYWNIDYQSKVIYHSNDREEPHEA
ncbi:hypothetical protein D6774_00620 [Candidatus Woesearchaeota archaeon]|jgi:hypothetical protein|nr:MAG: hypothetical protein D6774_00620 [Candidatus Woesearchaeota archaeon]